MENFSKNGGGNGEWRICRSAEETENAAAEFAATLPPDCTLALHGGLGAGKTTFVRGIARALGVAQEITSPSYNIYAIYDGTRGNGNFGNAETENRGNGGARRLVHMDAYRLASAEALDALMLDEFLVSPWILAIEWPEQISAALPPDAIHIDFEIVSAGTHRFRVRRGNA